MTEIQLRREIFLNWALILFGLMSEKPALAKSAEDLAHAPKWTEPDAQSLAMMSTSEPAFSAYRRSQPGMTPDWCQTAFHFERKRFSGPRTDWGFVLPVWILVGLICLSAQIALFHGLFSVLA